MPDYEDFEARARVLDTKLDAAEEAAPPGAVGKVAEARQALQAAREIAEIVEGDDDE